MSLNVMPRFGATRSTPEWARQGTIFDEGGDFGFGWGTGGGLLSGLPSGAREIVGSIYGAVRSGAVRVVVTPQPTTRPSPQQPTPAEGEVVAHDWGHLGRQFLGDFLGQATGIGAPTALPPAFGGPMAPSVPGPAVGGDSVAQVLFGTGDTACDGMVWSGGTPPKGYKVVNYCGQGVLRKIRRRRRRRMLSVSDKNDIAAIVSMVGKGQMASALINRSC